MIDYVNTKLKVSEIRFEKGYKCFVMEPVPDLHKHRHTLYDDCGNKYQPDCTSYRHDEQDLTIYTFEFKDTSIDIPIGTELMFEPEEWRRRLPDCAVKSIRFIQNTFSFPDGRIMRGIELLFESNGKVSMKTPRTSDQRYDRMVKFKADEDQLKMLFNNLLTCVSGNNCYCEQWMDDTARSMTITFENGEEYEYDTVFYNSKEKTNVKFIFDFLKIYENKGDYIYTTIEPEKRWYQIYLKTVNEEDNREVNGRKITKQAKQLKLRFFPIKNKDKNTFALFADRFEMEELLSVLERWDYDLNELATDPS